MSGNLLEVRNLKVQFPLDGGRIRKAVNDVSFAVERGSVTCLVGESGSGKSVTALSIIDLVPRPGTITGGEVLFEGHDVLSMKRKDLERLRGSDISIIFQEPMHAMDPVRRIGDQIVETILVHSPADHPVDKREAWKQARAWIERVELADPDKILDSYPHELSGGMLQRVMIAIALCCHPKLLIADEPTTALDVTIQAQILDLLMSLKDEYGLSVLFITHDFGVVAQIADKVAVMYAGRLLETGDVYDVFDHPAHPYTAGLLKTRPVIGRRVKRLYSLHDQFPDPDELTDGSWSEDNWDRIMADYQSRHEQAIEQRDEVKSEWEHETREAEEAQEQTRQAAPETVRADAAPNRTSPSSGAQAPGDETPLLEVRHLKKYFTTKRGVFSSKTDVVKGVNDVSLTIHAGEAVGLVGESGSGKTTFGQTVLRLQGKTGGEVLFKGHDLFKLPQRELRTIRPQMQYIFQDPYSALNPRMTIGRAIGEPLLEHRLATKTDVNDRVAQILEICGMDAGAMDRYPHEFSGGQRQRIVIARAMALKPDLVVADEPVASLDVSIQAQIINLFSDLQEIERTAFLFISHDLSVVEHLCERIVIMYLGAVVETGSRDEIFSHPIHPYTKELLAAVPVADPHLRRSAGEGDGVGSGAQTGASLYERRPYAKAIVDGTMPPLREVNADHWVAWPQ